MLADLIRIITPESLAAAIKSNPMVVQLALQKFDAYKSFGNALSDHQQVVISSNLNKMDAFFKSPQGRSSLGLLAEEFVDFVEKSK